jgi:hypothetical protein
MASPARCNRRNSGIHLTTLALLTCLACACAFAGEALSCSRAEPRASTGLREVLTRLETPQSRSRSEPRAWIGDFSARDRAVATSEGMVREPQAASLPCELAVLEAEDAEDDAAQGVTAARIDAWLASVAVGARESLPIARACWIAESATACALPRGPPDLHA